MKIFISHLSRNKALVREFSNYLPRFLSSWIDDDVLCWGEKFEKNIYWQITWETDFLISFIDKNTLESEWVVKELHWAFEIEKALDRTIILPILLDDLSELILPIELSERIFLRLNDYSKAAVEHAANQAVLSLFQIMCNSYSRNAVFRPRILNQTQKQDQLLEYLANSGTAIEEQDLAKISKNIPYEVDSTELYYRLETLVAHKFVSKSVVRTGGPQVYKITFLYELTRSFEKVKNRAIRD